MSANPSSVVKSSAIPRRTVSMYGLSHTIRPKSARNALLATETSPPLLRWRIEPLIKEEQWSPRQISGYIQKEGVRVSHEIKYAMMKGAECTNFLCRFVLLLAERRS